jgi:mannitol-1-phosphate/altronate dehydrogenase
VDTVNHTVQEAMNDPSVQQSVNNLIQNIQDMVPQAEGQG